MRRVKMDLENRTYLATSSTPKPCT